MGFKDMINKALGNAAKTGIKGVAASMAIGSIANSQVSNAMSNTANSIVNNLAGNISGAMKGNATQNLTGNQNGSQNYTNRAGLNTRKAGSTGLLQEWQKDQTYKLMNPAPWNVDELKKAVDVHDPASVAAYWAWSIVRLTDNYNDGMGMMKYLFADLEPFGRGYTEGGKSGRAGWDTYFNERLKDSDYNWLPRAYFEGASASNGFSPSRPLEIKLHYNKSNTETANSQTLQQLGRLNIEYWIESNAAGHKASIMLSKFDGSDRWYVTSGSSSSSMFYDQRSAITAEARQKMQSVKNDNSTEEEHRRVYG